LSSEKLELSHTINPFSKLSKKVDIRDIYSGNEKIPFRNRHPIFKSILRIEFEDAIREYLEIK